MANIVNLRKQAKLYLRWHRQRYRPVAAQIRSVLPRFRDLTDNQILDGDFKLNDAQELVARQSGFDTWRALEKGVQLMNPSVSETPAIPVLSQCQAQLFVSDIKAACAFFTGKLGFRQLFTYGDPPFYAAVKRDSACINLRLVCEPVYVGDVREREELLGASMTVESAAEIKQLFLQFQASGIDFFRPLKREPWGALDFIVRDPDGNLLLFAGPMP
jgi:catechol 2,3-dioxygenase-like lactoylglutathione lyase family enzyme